MSACSTVTPPVEPPAPAPVVQSPEADSRAGAPDGSTRPATRIPSRPRPSARSDADADAVASAQPRVEPLHPGANRPYRLRGRLYRPMTALEPFRQSGVASWYGRPFHGRKTANGERYNMHAMTAAHPTLPLPSYARVRNRETGATVIVRVNDRGPFAKDRVIDLSRAAARQLGMLETGVANVDVELILPDQEQGTVASNTRP